MKIESVGHGCLIATNGPDTVTAEYKRGFKLQDGYHPHWNITLNGQVIESVYGDREDAIAQMERLLALPSPAPMDETQTDAMYTAMGVVRGIVSVPLWELMRKSTKETIALLNKRLTPVRLWNIQCHAVGTSEDGKSVYIRISGELRPSTRNYVYRIPTSREWDDLVLAVGGDNSKMHWEKMYSWVNEERFCPQANRGYSSARSRSWNWSGFRDPYVGFRPAFEPLNPDTVNHDIEDGESVIVGTVFINDKPVHIPSSPTWKGDVEDYIPGATLKIKEALPDPEYQIHAIKVGEILIADRVLLKNISWDDLHQQGFYKNNIPLWSKSTMETFNQDK